MVFIRYLEGQSVGQYGNLRVVDATFDFAELLPRSKLAIHHGGLASPFGAKPMVCTSGLFDEFCKMVDCRGSNQSRRNISRVLQI